MVYFVTQFTDITNAFFLFIFKMSYSFMVYAKCNFTYASKGITDFSQLIYITLKCLTALYSDLLYRISPRSYIKSAKYVLKLVYST